MSEPIRWAASFTLPDPDVGTVPGRVLGVFEGALADPAAAPFLSKRIGLEVTDAIMTAAPKPSQGVDYAAVAATLNASLQDTYQELGAVGAVVVHDIKIDSAAPQPAAAPPWQAAAPGPPPLAPVIAPSAPPRPLTDDVLDTTAEAIVAPLLEDDALPFRQGERAQAPAPAEVAESPDIGKTGFATALSDDDVLPFADEHPELTLEQYASLCVERALDPSNQSEVAKRYRVLTKEALQALDARWRRRFDDEGALYQRWQQAYLQYKTWLEGNKP